MLIEVQGLSKRYRPRGPMVVEEVSFTIDRGETLAIFGDSGSGKSTIGQILAGIYPATAGEVWLDGQRLSYPLRGPARRRIQILFQHPEVAFNPKLRLIDSMREPYRLFHLPYTRQGLCDYLERYGIYEEHLDRFPAELSGGELQRLALARAMLMDPSFLVLDAGVCVSLAKRRIDAEHSLTWAMLPGDDSIFSVEIVCMESIMTRSGLVFFICT